MLNWVVKQVNQLWVVQENSPPLLLDFFPSALFTAPGIVCVSSLHCRILAFLQSSNQVLSLFLPVSLSLSPSPRYFCGTRVWQPCAKLDSFCFELATCVYVLRLCMQIMNIYTLAHCLCKLFYHSSYAWQTWGKKKVYHHLNFCNRGEKEAADTWDLI